MSVSSFGTGYVEDVHFDYDVRFSMVPGMATMYGTLCMYGKSDLPLTPRMDTMYIPSTATGKCLMYVMPIIIEISMSASVIYNGN